MEQATVITGKENIAKYRLIVIRSGVRLEAKGMRASRGVSCTKLAKQETGLKTNDRQKLIEALDKLIAA